MGTRRSLGSKGRRGGRPESFSLFGGKKAGPVVPISSIHHPPHYTQTKVECADVIESLSLQWELAGINPWHLGNAMKYIWRAGLKGPPREDIEKAIWYLNRSLRNNKNES